MVRSAFSAITILAAALFAQMAQAEVLIGSATPITGKMAWFGEQHQRAVALAVSEINASGGLLGETVEVVEADDFCDAEQAVAAANKLIAYGVDVVVGHNCSGAAIPASKVYADAGVLMITGTATNPVITEQGFEQTFRMVARDTLQGEMAAAYLAEHRQTDGSRSCTTARATARASPRPPRRN
jgi:branched-chain amino acid transport system substrate-binding protein